MKAAHRAYQRAREALLVAHEDGDPDTISAAGEALQAATVPVADELDEAWQRNVAMVQAAKQACRDATTARIQVQLEVSMQVAERLRYPRWPRNAPLVTEVEQARLDAAEAAEQAAVEANRRTEARFKEGVRAEQLAGVD